MPLILPEYIQLLYIAYEASNAVDCFDLHSDNPQSTAEWRRLCEQERADHLALVAFITAHTNEILSGLEGITQRSRVPPPIV